MIRPESSTTWHPFEMDGLSIEATQNTVKALSELEMRVDLIDLDLGPYPPP